MEEKKSLKERCKEGWNRHKKKVKIVGGVVLAFTGGFFLVQNWDELLAGLNGFIDAQELQEVSGEVVEVFSEIAEETALDVVGETRKVAVSPHVMNLPLGKQASEAAKAYARECNIVLGERQTMRHGCERMIAA